MKTVFAVLAIACALITGSTLFVLNLINPDMTEMWFMLTYWPVYVFGFGLTIVFGALATGKK